MHDLDTENPYGVYAGTPLAEALKAWKAVHYERSAAELHSHEGPLLRRPGLARAARHAAEREAPLEAAYRAMAELERARIAPQLADAEAHLAAREAAEAAHRRYTRIDHPDVPRRLDWIEREIKSLGGELSGTRMDLDKAMGQDWERDDPSWAREVCLVNQSFPNALDLSADRPHGPSPRPHIERDLGPDLGLGL